MTLGVNTCKKNKTKTKKTSQHGTGATSKHHILQPKRKGAECRAWGVGMGVYGLGFRHHSGADGDVDFISVAFVGLFVTCALF